MCWKVVNKSGFQGRYRLVGGLAMAGRWVLRLVSRCESRYRVGWVSRNVG